MATCLNYNCDTLTDHEVATLACKGPRPAGISEAGWRDCAWRACFLQLFPAHAAVRVRSGF